MRALKTIGLAAILVLPLAAQGLAQTPDWGKWEEAALGSDKSVPPGVTYGGRGWCEGARLSGKHAYWACRVRSAGAFWEGTSDAIYTCPDGKGFRRLEKVRYTKIPCGNKDWQITKRLADLYEETWQKNVIDPPEITNPQTPPTEKADLPPDTSDTPPSWDGGGPPWAPQEAEKKDDTKTDTGKTDTAKTDGGKTDSGKTDTAKTDTSKTDAGKTDAKTDTSKTDTDKKVTDGGTTPTGKKGMKKDAKKGSKSIARRRGDDDYAGQGGDISPEAAMAIGTGIMYGLGGFGIGGRGHMGGGRMDGGNRMMDR